MLWSDNLGEKKISKQSIGEFSGKYTDGTK
jgi:hypothetical protein